MGSMLEFPPLRAHWTEIERKFSEVVPSLELYKDMYISLCTSQNVRIFRSVCCDFFSKFIFVETKLYSLQFSNRRKNNQGNIICFSEHGTPYYYTLRGGGKIKFQSKHSLFLIVGCFSSFHCPNNVEYRNVLINKY